MPDLPKYAHWVAERRFLVDGRNMPALDDSAARGIEDLYIDGGRLRLRKITMPGGAEPEFKLAKKYADLRQVMTEAVSSFVHDVETGTFPDDEHSYS